MREPVAAPGPALKSFRAGSAPFSLNADPAFFDTRESGEYKHPAMPGVELIRSFLEHAEAKGSRSTALSPLGWLAVILVSGLLAAFTVHAPLWAQIGLAVAGGLCVMLYFGAYLYFMLKDPDALRSERFKLSKMAMERSKIGDTLQGFLEPDGQEPFPLLSSPASTQPEQER